MVFSVDLIKRTIGEEITQQVKERVPRRSNALADSLFWNGEGIEGVPYAPYIIPRVIDASLLAVDVSVIDDIVRRDLDKAFGV